MRCAIYVRVSTAHQNDEAQHDELVSLCKRSGWDVVDIYREKVSGTKGSNERAELKRLMRDARLRRFSKVVVWSVDRLGRSMPHLVTVLTELKEINIHIFSFKQGIDTETTMGSMLFQFIGIFAEFENEMRKERQTIGIAKAKQKGVRFGKKPTPSSKLREIKRLRSEGVAILRICKDVGVSPNTVYRAISA
jgi:DNA invertase Pin-like site-specific DNA recombinase